MKLIRKRLEEARRDTGLSWEIIEKGRNNRDRHPFKL
jgi:hypothetical protein